MNKRGQVAIFVILAIVIVAIILVFFLIPRINVAVSDVDPSGFLRNCIEPEVEDSLFVLTKQGGSVNPDNYLLYQDEKIQYLCYTDTPYVPCKVQQPLLIKHVEDEIKDYVEPKARQCVNDLKSEYERRGFNVRTDPGSINVEIALKRIEVEFDSPMSVSKEGTQTFQKFSVGIDSNLYDLLSIATNIVQFESTLGDSETLLYVQYYPNLRIEKVNRDEGDTIYILSDVVTEDRFTFASRSQYWSPEYAEV